MLALYLKISIFNLSKYNFLVLAFLLNYLNHNFLLSFEIIRSSIAVLGSQNSTIEDQVLVLLSNHFKFIDIAWTSIGCFLWVLEFTGSKIINFGMHVLFSPKF